MQFTIFFRIQLNIYIRFVMRNISSPKSWLRRWWTYNKGAVAVWFQTGTAVGSLTFKNKQQDNHIWLALSLNKNSRLSSTRCKYQLASSLRTISFNHNARQFILIRYKHSQRACFTMSGKEPSSMAFVMSIQLPGKQTLNFDVSSKAFSLASF